MKYYNLKKFLWVVVLLAGNLLYAAETQPAPAPSEAVNGTLSSIDMQNRIIIVGGTQIHLPALGHIDKKTGQQVSVIVRRDRNGRKLFVGFVSSGGMGGSLGQ